MHLRRVSLLALLAALVSSFVVAPVAPVAAVPAEGILLRGSRSAWVDLYVYVNRTISVADVSMKTKGSYVGFFLSPAPANRDTVGALVMPRVGATGGSSETVVKLGQSWDVQAGKYRMFLLTDGPAEVFVPIEGQGFRGWQPRGSAPVSFRRADFDVAAGSPGDSKHVPVYVRSRSLIAAAAMASSSSLTAVDHMSACVTATASCSEAVAVGTRVPLGRAVSSGAMLVAPGTHSGVFDISRIGGLDAGSHVDAVVMVLTIGRQT